MFIVSASHKDDSSFSHFLVGCKKKKKKKNHLFEMQIETQFQHKWVTYNCDLVFRG